MTLGTAFAHFVYILIASVYVWKIFRYTRSLCPTSIKQNGQGTTDPTTATTILIFFIYKRFIIIKMEQIFFIKLIKIVYEMSILLIFEMYFQGIKLFFLLLFRKSHF